MHFSDTTTHVNPSACTTYTLKPSPCSLVESELEHSASLSGAVTALRQDEQTRMNEAVAKTRLEVEV